MPEPTITVLALLALAGITAGYVDAVVGGGGLVQLPALLLGLPEASTVQILATNKLAPSAGRRSARSPTTGGCAPTRAPSCR